MAAPPTGATSLGLGSITPRQLRLLSMTQTWDDKTIDRGRFTHQVQLLPPLFWQLGKPKATFGRFHDIPTELTFAIFEHTPLGALMNLRQTNSCAKHLVESWSPFREVVSSGADLVRAAIAIEASKFLTVPRLLAVIFSHRCELCGQLGSFVQLVKCMRCCFYCLSNDRRLHCISASFAAGCIPNPNMGDSAVGALGLKISKKDLPMIPKVYTLPQKSVWGSEMPTRDWALDYTTALQFCREPDKTIYIPSILQKRIARGEGRPCYYEISLLTGRIHPLESNTLRFRTAIYQPGMIRKRSGLITLSDGGLFCKGCRVFWGPHSQGRHYLEHVMHSSSEIVQHVERCPYAKVLWNIILKITTPSPQTGNVLIPFEDLLARAQTFRWRRSVNFGEMPWQFSIWFDREYLETKKLSFGDSLIEETQASWAVARQFGSHDILRYIGLWKALKATCKRRRVFFAGLHDL